MTMSSLKTAPGGALSAGSVVNDFSIEVATVNGSGSQTANLVLMRAIFRMGIPVSGKNLFPSNIEGLPTWFTIRVSEQGYVARREGVEILVAMNEATVLEDVRGLKPGAVAIMPDHMPELDVPPGVYVYRAPFKTLIRKHVTDVDGVRLMTNMLYVGVVAHVLGIELATIEAALTQQFHGRTKLVTSNFAVVKEGLDWAVANVPLEGPYRVERRNLTAGKILIDGNSAAALGSVYGGVTLVAWYPITPGTSLNSSLEAFLNRLRRDPQTGAATYAVVQAEDELAAIGIVLGGGWAGARSMTATSGPGISLMAEFAGLGFFAEIPGVIWDVTRVGPSTGLPTRTSQGDLLFLHRLSHGDTRHPVLLPGSVGECFDMGIEALNLAERLQTPIFVLSDLDLGMNTWMSEPFAYPAKPIDRGKVLTAEEIDKARGFKRYADVDGDGIPYRTLPGTDSAYAAYFTRGTGHTENATYSERPEDWNKNLSRLHRKIDGARTILPQPEAAYVDGAHIGLLTFGSSQFAVLEARDRLAAAGLPTGYMRVKAVPFSRHLREFVERHDRVYVVENNHLGQLAELAQLDLPDLAGKIRSLAYLDGLPLTARHVMEALQEREQMLAEGVGR
jgi:2-oxoglutarate ferredoxin oxidoreductase subunit alpha